MLTNWLSKLILLANPLIRSTKIVANVVSIKYSLKFTLSRFYLAEKYVLVLQAYDVSRFRSVIIAAKIVLHYSDAFRGLVA